jgi:hypothetical protein
MISGGVIMIQEQIHNQETKNTIPTSQDSSKQIKKPTQKINGID